MKRALISVSDKTNIVEFCKVLEKHDYQIISTGGTFTELVANKIKVTNISEITKFPEILDGRVKTLSPYVHGGLLFKRNSEEHVSEIAANEIAAIDLVCVNLYPFEQASLTGSLEQAIENIDIGGPSMIRSAGKNYRDVLVVTSPEDYQLVIESIENDNITSYLHSYLGAKAFQLTARYDSIISEYLNNNITDATPKSISLTYDLNTNLRYGENPHQQACFYTRIGGKNTIEECEFLHGKQLSYNNIQDGQAALDLLSEFTIPCVCAIKHMTPCGVGLGENILQAWDKAYSSDPISIFGGIVVTNQVVTLEVATKMSEIFLEVVIAPGYDEQALALLQRKKNLRILKLHESTVEVKRGFKSVGNGILIQDVDTVSNYDIELKCVTDKSLTPDQLNQLRFGQSIAKHVKSNAIVVVKDNQTLGIGGGQTSRIDAAKIALDHSKEICDCEDLYMASDAFFPFSDVVELAAAYGVVGIIQPGGSLRDQDSIDKCNELGISMYFSNIRHFKH